MKIKGQDVLKWGIGGGALAAIFYLIYHHGSTGLGAKARYAGTTGGKIPHRYSAGSAYQMGRYAQANLARKYSPHPGEGDSGITNVGQYDSGGVKWHGWAASPWSPLTAKNENYTYARTPTNKLLHTYRPGKLEHLKLQGATGLTRYLPGITYTYW